MPPAEIASLTLPLDADLPREIEDEALHAVERAREVGDEYEGVTVTGEVVLRVDELPVYSRSVRVKPTSVKAVMSGVSWKLSLPSRLASLPFDCASCWLQVS